MRYPVKLGVKFLIRSGKVHSMSGTGTTVNISSTGLLFRASKRLDGGEKVVVAVDWPTADANKPMILLFQGYVVWMKGSQVGLAVSHYGFLPNNTPGSDNPEKLDKIAAPRQLTPTRPVAYSPTSVRQWKRQ